MGNKGIKDQEPSSNVITRETPCLWMMKNLLRGRGHKWPAARSWGPWRALCLLKQPAAGGRRPAVPGSRPPSPGGCAEPREGGPSSPSCSEHLCWQSLASCPWQRGCLQSLRPGLRSGACVGGDSREFGAGIFGATRTHTDTHRHRHTHTHTLPRWH